MAKIFLNLIDLEKCAYLAFGTCGLKSIYASKSCFNLSWLTLLLDIVMVPAKTTLKVMQNCSDKK